MKPTIIKGFAVLLALAALAPFFSATVGASTETATSEAIPIVTAAGRGWFVFNGLRHNFAFAAHEGKLSEVSGWRYVPKGYFSMAVIDLKGAKIFDVRSVRIWRFRTDQVDGGLKVIIAGMANFLSPKGVLENWWFRVEARDIDESDKNGDGCAISLWRPGGADNVGCWTARLFDPKDPTSLKLNPTPFYRAFGKLKGGFVEITP